MKFKKIKIKRPKIRIRRPRVRIRWRKKTSKWVIGVVSLFFISLLAFQLVLMNYARSILQNILNMQIEQVTGGIYTSSFEDIEISYTRKDLLIRNLHLSPRNKKNSLDKPGSDGPDLYDLFIPEVKINGINFRKAYLEKFLEIQNIELQAPRLSLNLNLDDPAYCIGHLTVVHTYKTMEIQVHKYYG